MYISESAPPVIRGSLVSCYQLAITLGILIAQLVDLGMERIESTAAWRVPIGSFTTLTLSVASRVLIRLNRSSNALGNDPHHWLFLHRTSHRLAYRSD